MKKLCKFIDDLDENQKCTVEVVCTIISVICIAIAVVTTCLNLSK